MGSGGVCIGRRTEKPSSKKATTKAGGTTPYVSTKQKLESGSWTTVRTAKASSRNFSKLCSKTSTPLSNGRATPPTILPTRKVGARSIVPLRRRSDRLLRRAPFLAAPGLPRRPRLGSIRSRRRCRSLHRRLLRWRVGHAIRTIRPRIRIAGDRYFQPLAQRVFQLVANVLVFLQENPRILTALAHALAAEADPRPALFQHTFIDAEINQVTFARNSFAVHDVELGFAERRRHFVLHHF